MHAKPSLLNPYCFINTYQHSYIHGLQAWDANVVLASNRLLFLRAWEPRSLILYDP